MTVTDMRNSCYSHAALSLFDYTSSALHAIAAVTPNPIRVNVTTVTDMRNSCYSHAALSLHEYNVMSFALHAIAAVTSNPIRVIVTL